MPAVNHTLLLLIFVLLCDVDVAVWVVQGIVGTLISGLPWLSLPSTLLLFSSYFTSVFFLLYWLYWYRPFVLDLQWNRIVVMAFILIDVWFCDFIVIIRIYLDGVEHKVVWRINRHINIIMIDNLLLIYQCFLISWCFYFYLFYLLLFGLFENTFKDAILILEWWFILSLNLVNQFFL